MKNKKRLLSLIICIAMIGIVCMIPEKISAASNNIVQAKMPDGSIVTVTANKDLGNIALPSNRGLGGVDVDFIITSNKTPIKNITIGTLSSDFSTNRIEFTQHFTSTNSEDSCLIVTLEDGASCSFGFRIKPAQLISKTISIRTDPTGMVISGFDFPDWFGSRLYVDVYKDSAMKNLVSTLNGPIGNGALAIHKSRYKWYKPNTTYYLKIYGVERYNNSDGSYTYAAAAPIKKSVKTSPGVNPVVKSIKISNIKVKNLSTLFVKKYHTTYTMTIKLSKRASNIQGIKVFAAGNYYTVKGKGITFKVHVSNVTDRSYKGLKTNYRLCTYSASDSIGGAYSSWTKSKKYRVK